MTPDLRDALAPVIAVFDRMGIPFVVGGSVASSWLGVPRTTLDVDIVADLKPDHTVPLYNALRHAYYLDPADIAEAISSHSSFSLIHNDTMQKVDVFVLKPHPYDQQSFSRRCSRPLFESADSPMVPVATPEDIILNKLEWFQLGNRISERQWKDVIGVLKVQAGNLDWDYLRRWAEELGLRALLDEAERESA